MGYKNFASMNIAVIGEGKVSETLAQRLALAEHQISIGLKEGQTVDADILDEYDNICVCDIESAAADADIIILAVPVDNVREVAYHLGDVRKKVIIGACGNVMPKPAEFVHTVHAIKSITGAQHVVKSFNCMGYDDLMSPCFAAKKADMFVAGDSKKAKETTMLLARDMGFSNCYDFGTDESVPLLEDMAMCWYNLAVTQKLGSKISFKLVRG